MNKKNVTKDVESFLDIIEKHRQYLLQIRHLPSKAVTTDRNRIIHSLSNDIRFALWYGSITYDEYRLLCENVRQALSFDSLYGIKQLSIFDDIPEDELHPKVNEDGED